MSENILDMPEDQRPVIINDRGSQMKARSVRKIFENHHMPQLFARPRDISAGIFPGTIMNICIPG